ncbi:hypothetical protein H4R20_002348, partial [Coemansia guatemalensis]
MRLSSFIQVETISDMENQSHRMSSSLEMRGFWSRILQQDPSTVHTTVDPGTTALWIKHSELEQASTRLYFEDIVSLTRTGELQHWEQGILEAVVKAAFAETVADIDSADPYYLRSLGSNRHLDGSHLWKGWNKITSQSTESSYISVMVSFCRALLLVCHSPDHSTAYSLNEDQRAAALSLHSNIAQLHGGFEASLGTQTFSVTNNPDILGVFWQLLQKLFMCQHDVNQSRWRSYAVYMFVCCNGRNEHAFAKPTKIRPALVRLLYWARGAISQFIKSAFTSGRADGTCRPSYSDLLLQHHVYLEDNQPTACGALFGLNGVLTKAQTEYYMQTRIVYVDGSDRMTLEFDGKRISMCNIADAYFHAIDSIHKLFKILLQNFAYDKSALRPSNIDDDFGDDRVSCGFISHNLASIGNLGAQFLSHLTENGLIKLSGDRRHVIQTSSAKKWLRKADELMHYILFAIHLGYGQPARATELATLTYNNLPNFYRGLFVSKAKGAVCLSSLYWKSQQQQQRSRQVLRFVDPMLSQILCTFLAIIRPADYAIRQGNPDISSEQSRQKLKSVYLHYLFVHSGTRIQGQDIREIFQRLWKRASTVDITYQEYRHISR